MGAGHVQPLLFFKQGIQLRFRVVLLLILPRPHRMVAGGEIIAKIGLILLQNPLRLRLLALVVGLGIVMQTIIADMQVVAAVRTGLVATDPIAKIAGFSAMVAKNHRSGVLAKRHFRLKM